MHFAIFQVWGLGDLVMTTPVIAEFRRLYPDSRLTLVVQGNAQVALMKESPLVDQILDMPSRSDRPALLRFFLGLRRQKIDVAFIATRIASWLPWVLKGVTGVPVIVGDGEKSQFLYSVHNRVDPAVHRVDRMLETFALWSRESPAAPRFPIPCGKPSQEARSILADNGLRPLRFVVIHPGSSLVGGTDKRIPVDVARRVANDILDHRVEFSVAFIFGPDEVDFIGSFSTLGERQVILSGHSLANTIAIISQSAGFIGTDSGLGHIAAAFGVRTITLVGPTIASETAPYGDCSTVIKRREQLLCQPCWGTPLYGRCPYGVRCMHELPESEIAKMAIDWDTRP